MAQRRIALREEEIADFCRRWQITELALFGSVLRDDFRPESDVDVLVTFASGARHSVFDLATMQDELQTRLGRRVHLVEKAALRNPFRRREILRTMEIVYAA